MYMKRMLEMIRQELGAGRLRVPDGQRAESWQRVTINLAKKKWNVKICERYSHGAGVATYLARYMRGAPIRPERIVSWIRDQVRFSYLDNRADPKVRRIMQLSTEEFVRRLFSHLPEPNLKVVRHWGLYNARCKEQLNECRDLLGQGAVEDVPEMGWRDFCDRLGGKAPECCPTCGVRLVDGPVVMAERKQWPLKLPQQAA
jgi:hypothetical protein